MKLFGEELNSRNLHLKNRLVMPPMATGGCDETGHVTQKLLDYYAEKTAGGYFAMVITEHSYVSPEGIAHKKQLSIADDSAIEGLSQIVSVIHENGSKAIAQLSHAGIVAKESGLPPIGPSAIAWKGGEPAQAMSEKEIDRVVVAFAKAASRAKQAGYDGIELHSAHGYLMNQFYSPLTNWRKDAYGGDGKTRLHFHLKTIQAVRETVGEEYPVLVRLGALDYQNGGSTLEDAICAAQAFEKAGVSILDISGGMNGYLSSGRSSTEGYYTDVTAALKKQVSIPILMTGGITDAAVAERILQEKEADLIGVGRAVLKDSKWAEKSIRESLR